MNDAQIRNLTFRRFELQLAGEKINTEIKDINSKLIAEAASRPQEHEPLEDSDGTAWKATAAGCEVRVVFPTDTLKETIKENSSTWNKILEVEAHGEKLVKDPVLLDALFEPVPAFKPRANFRAVAVERLGTKPGEKVIKLCTTASSPKVLVKETA